MTLSPINGDETAVLAPPAPFFLPILPSVDLLLLPELTPSISGSETVKALGQLTVPAERSR
jgi:hypothetical protein